MITHTRWDVYLHITVFGWTFTPHTTSSDTFTLGSYIHAVRAQGFQVITLTAMAAAFTTAGIESVSWARICKNSHKFV